MLEITAEKNFMKKANLSLVFVTDNPLEAITYFENYVSENSDITNYR